MKNKNKEEEIIIQIFPYYEIWNTWVRVLTNQGNIYNGKFDGDKFILGDKIEITN